MGEAARQTLLAQEMLQGFSGMITLQVLYICLWYKALDLKPSTATTTKIPKKQPNFCFLTVPHSDFTSFCQGGIEHYFAAFHSCRVVLLFFSSLVVNVRFSRSVEQPCHVGPVI